MQSDTPSCSYTLPTRLTAETACEVTEALRKLPTAAQWTLDSSGVEEISACGAQVLVAAHKHMTAMGNQLLITGQPPLFMQALADIGLDWLNQPSR